MQGSDKAMAAHEQHRQIASLHFVNDSWLRSSLILISHFVNVQTSTPAFCKVASGKTSQKPFSKHLVRGSENGTQIPDKPTRPTLLQVQGTEVLLAIRCRETLRKEALDIWAADEAVVDQNSTYPNSKLILKNTAFKKGIPEFACPSCPRSPLARHRWARDPVGYPTRLAEKSTRL